MSIYTTNLNLLKKDPATEGNDYFNIETMLNDNWDKIDAGVAAKETPEGAQAKVDNLAGAGRTTETVKGNADAITALSQTVTSHEAEITSLQNEVENSVPVGTVVLSNTAPVVSIDAKVNGGLNFNMTASPLLVNLLGSDGDCEDISKWNSPTGATSSLDTTNKVFGNNGLKVTSSTTNTEHFVESTIANKYPITPNKYYFVAGYVKPGDTAHKAVIRPVIWTTNPNRTISTSPVNIDTSKFIRCGLKFQASDIETSISIRCQIFLSNGVTAVYTGAGEIAYFDGIAIYEITADEYNNLTVDQLLAKYPYVNSIQPLMNPCLTVRGKNLFDKSTVKYNTTISTTNVEVTNAGDFLSAYIPIKDNTLYKISGSGVNGIYVLCDKNYNLLYQSWGTDINNNVSARYIRFRGLMANLDSIQLEEGTVATTYEPYKEPSAILVGEFAKLPNTTYADTVKYENGKAKKLAKVKKVVLDGNYTWIAGTDNTGFKEIKIGPIFTDSYTMQQSSVVYGYAQATRYDGKILKEQQGATNADTYLMYYTNDTFYLTIADTDSGWGETYTPLAAEIQALTNGWKLNNGTFGTPYNDTGTKTWTKWNATDNTGAVTTVPTTKADGWTGWATLWYALATPVEEEIHVIGNALSVFEGKCTLDVQTGIVYEKANPVLYSGDSKYYVADKGVGSSTYFKYNNKIIYNIYKNGVIDNNWEIYLAATNNKQNGISIYSARIDATKYDPAAEYYVLYQVLPEEYNNQQISLIAYYSQNLRDAHNELAETMGNMAKDLSLLEESVKAEWKSWIPTLTWTTGTPATNVVAIARYQEKDKKVYINFHYKADDGNVATALKISLPKTPKANSANIALNTQQKVNTTWANRMAYINDSDTNGIQFRDFATCTDAQAVEVIVTGFYEVS